MKHVTILFTVKKGSGYVTFFNKCCIEKNGFSKLKREALRHFLKLYPRRDWKLCYEQLDVTS